MTREQLDRLERLSPEQIIASARLGDVGGGDRLVVQIEANLNLEWWRGYHAAIIGFRMPRST